MYGVRVGSIEGLESNYSCSFSAQHDETPEVTRQIFIQTLVSVFGQIASMCDLGAVHSKAVHKLQQMKTTCQRSQLSSID